jgi:hypothetical protein
LALEVGLPAAAVICIVALLGWAFLGPWLATRRVQGLQTRFGSTVGEWIAKQYEADLRAGNARWADDDNSDYNVYFYVHTKNPGSTVSGCAGDWVWSPLFRWRVRGSRIVANSKAALDLTPDLAPLRWAPQFDLGCYFAPANEEEAARLDQDLAALAPYPCPQYRCQAEL